MNVPLGQVEPLPNAHGTDCENVVMPPVSLLSTKKKSRINRYFREMEAFLRCSWQASLDVLDGLPLMDFPLPIIEAVASGNLIGLSFNDFGGEYRITLLEIKKHFLDLQTNLLAANELMESFVMELCSAKAAFKAMHKRDKANVWQQLKSYGRAAIQAGGAVFACYYGQYAACAKQAVGAAESFVNGYSQGLHRTANKLDGYAKQYDFLAKVVEALYGMEQTMKAVGKAMAGLQQQIERLKLLELEQEQALERAERLGEQALASYVGDVDDKVKAYRKMTLLGQVRARRAVYKAKKLMFIARRALEMKVVVDLSEEKEPGVIGDPPARWADKLYSLLAGIDVYGATEPLQESQIDEADPAGVFLQYCQKLEDYVYNYPFQYPFADSSDTAVISMRDDLGSYGDECIDVLCTKNLVAEPEAFEEWTSLAEPEGCGSVYVEANVAEGPFGDEGADLAVFTYDSEGGRLPSSPRVRKVHRSEFPRKERLAMVSPVAYADTCDEGYASSYTGSLYLKLDPDLNVEGKPYVHLSLVAEVRDEETFETMYVVDTETVTLLFADSWQRYSVTMDGIPEPSEGEVLTLKLEVRPEVELAGGLTSGGELSLIGGVAFWAWGAQIESGVEATSYQTNPVYGPAVDEFGEAICNVSTVQDPWTGEPEEVYYFPAWQRSQRFRDSFAVKCAFDEFAVQGQLPEDCYDRGGIEYLEKPFTITLSGIESGDVIQQGQIGGGNYNYRIVGLAVNLVGTNVKDCALNPEAGTTCYANMFIPYDLIQDGVVRLRDHSLKQHQYKLSVGKIYEGKAAAAEILLTNPLSSNNQSIISQYTKQEFAGRPIQGTYTLRIYAVPSLRWENLEDVQILLNYRYWSPFSN